MGWTCAPSSCAIGASGASPNQNLEQHTLAEDKGEAGYVTASYTSYPWFAYGEMFTMDPDYSTTAFMANSLGGIDYSSEIFHLFEFVDDNDDQDRFADWQRAGQFGVGIGASGGIGRFRLRGIPPG